MAPTQEVTNRSVSSPTKWRKSSPLTVLTVILVVGRSTRHRRWAARLPLALPRALLGGPGGCFGSCCPQLCSQLPSDQGFAPTLSPQIITIYRPHSEILSSQVGFVSFLVLTALPYLEIPQNCCLQYAPCLRFSMPRSSLVFMFGVDAGVILLGSSKWLS